MDARRSHRSREDGSTSTSLLSEVAAPVKVGALAGAVVLAAVACSESEFGITDPADTGRIDVAFQVPGATGSSSGSRVGSVTRSVTVSSDPELVVDTAQVVEYELQLGRQGTECVYGAPGTDSGGDDGSDCEEIALETRVDSLPVEDDDGVELIIENAPVEPGTFDRFEFRLNVPEGDEIGDQDVLEARPDLRGVSFVIVGSYQGEPFRLEMDPVGEVVVTADSPLVIEDQGEGRISLVWNVQSWFEASDGSLIDPVAAQEDEALRNQIETNMVETLEVSTSQ